MVTRVAFEAFSWYNFADDQSWLRVDVSIKYGTEDHTQAMLLAVVAILVYPVGLLLSLAVLLFRARHAITLNQPTELSTAIADARRR